MTAGQLAAEGTFGVQLARSAADRGLTVNDLDVDEHGLALRQVLADELGAVELQESDWREAFTVLDQVSMRAAAVGGRAVRCRSCEQPVRWVITAEKGKRMPLDPLPHHEGTVRIIAELAHGVAMVRVLSNLQRTKTTEPLYRAHFTTCPDADEHRRRAQVRRLPNQLCPICHYRLAPALIAAGETAHDPCLYYAEHPEERPV